MQSVRQFTHCRRLGRLAYWLLLATTLIAFPGLAATTRSYTVKPSDTLSSVARKYDLSVAELAQFNGLKPTSWLTTGQRLKIPMPQDTVAPTPAPVVKSPLSSTVQKAITSPAVKPGRWRHIIIHHSGTSEGSATGMNQYHLRVRHMENGLAYHFVIGNGHGMRDGEIYVGNRWKKQLDGGHLASETQNSHSIGICLVGNFDKNLPTARQLESLKTLIESLENRCNLSPSAIKTHQQINVVHTRCPGERFPTESFLRNLRSQAAN